MELASVIWEEGFQRVIRTCTDKVEYQEQLPDLTWTKVEPTNGGSSHIIIEALKRACLVLDKQATGM